MLTGASGNLGGELIRGSCFDFVPLNRNDWGVLDQKMSSGIDVVIHAASDLRTQVAVSPVKLMNSNILSTARLLESMREYQVPRIIFLSTCAVYGEGMVSDENAKCSPISVNGISKLLNENMMFEFCKSNGIKLEILRVFNLYGGDDQFSILSHIKRALINGKPFVLNNSGIAQRDFIHVSDVASIIRNLLNKDIPCTHLNIGTGIATKISILVDIVKECFPELIIQHRQAVEAEYSRADISKLSQMVEHRFIRIEDYLRNDFMKIKA